MKETYKTVLQEEIEAHRKSAYKQGLTFGIFIGLALFFILFLLVVGFFYYRASLS